MNEQDTEVSRPAPALLKRREVERRTGLSCTSIYRKMDAGTFPRPLRVGSKNKNGAVRWRESDIDAWLGGLRLADVGMGASGRLET